MAVLCITLNVQMLLFSLFIVEFFALFWLSRRLTKALSKFIFRLTKSQGITIYFLSLFFLPGVIVHELSHMLLAGLTFVRVGDMEFIPKLTDDGVRMGSVAIGKTDAIRRAIIGIAPIILGVALLFLIAVFYTSDVYPFLSWQTLVLLYVVFQVGNTMFSSPKDLEGFLEISAAVIFFAVVLVVFSYLAEISLLPLLSIFVFLSPSLSLLVKILGVIIAVDVAVIGVLKIIDNRR